MAGKRTMCFSVIDTLGIVTAKLFADISSPTNFTYC
jgi:hypothetical protein